MVWFMWTDMTRSEYIFKYWLVWTAETELFRYCLIGYLPCWVTLIIDEIFVNVVVVRGTADVSIYLNIVWTTSRWNCIKHEKYSGYIKLSSLFILSSGRSTDILYKCISFHFNLGLKEMQLINIEVAQGLVPVSVECDLRFT